MLTSEQQAAFDALDTARTASLRKRMLTIVVTVALVSLVFGLVGQRVIGVLLAGLLSPLAVGGVIAFLVGSRRTTKLFGRPLEASVGEVVWVHALTRNVRTGWQEAISPSGTPLMRFSAIVLHSARDEEVQVTVPAIHVERLLRRLAAAFPYASFGYTDDLSRRYSADPTSLRVPEWIGPKPERVKFRPPWWENRLIVLAAGLGVLGALFGIMTLSRYVSERRANRAHIDLLMAGAAKLPASFAAVRDCDKRISGPLGLVELGRAADKFGFNSVTSYVEHVMPPSYVDAVVYWRSAGANVEALVVPWSSFDGALTKDACYVSGPLGSGGGEARAAELARKPPHLATDAR